VPLSHSNLLANIRQMRAVCDLHNGDRIFNALPLFHSFGLTVGCLYGLTRGCHVFLHPSPLHLTGVPNAIYDDNSTVVLSTNTFLSGYARRAHPYDFRCVRYLLAAGEKAQDSMFRVWSERFGIRILEGYGATECGPALAANVPLACKVGSAGRFLPGIEWALTPVDGIHPGGALQVRGPNVMRAYLNAGVQTEDPDRWHNTGDVVHVDDEGYVHILGRLKRFAKVGSEMISLCALEDSLNAALPATVREATVAVLTMCHPKKGELLTAITDSRAVTRALLREILLNRGYSNICVPREIHFLARIPKLGTGKIDHHTLQRMLADEEIPLQPERACHPS
jgi:acyl-[acyl-carrier-protein]-phospholipid O-acyltransferase/long-chain-fatty-acid--[acyl-carrier-protein] ligase